MNWIKIVLISISAIMSILVLFLSETKKIFLRLVLIILTIAAVIFAFILEWQDTIDYKTQNYEIKQWKYKADEAFKLIKRQHPIIMEENEKIIKLTKELLPVISITSGTFKNLGYVGKKYEFAIDFKYEIINEYAGKWIDVDYVECFIYDGENFIGKIKVQEKDRFMYMSFRTSKTINGKSEKMIKSPKIKLLLSVKNEKIYSNIYNLKSN